MRRPPDVVKFNQPKGRIKSEFLKLESKSDWIQIWILQMPQYFEHNLAQISDLGDSSDIGKLTQQATNRCEIAFSQFGRALFQKSPCKIGTQFWTNPILICTRIVI